MKNMRFLDWSLGHDMSWPVAYDIDAKYQQLLQAFPGVVLTVNGPSYGFATAYAMFQTHTIHVEVKIRAFVTLLTWFWAYGMSLLTMSEVSLVEGPNGRFILIPGITTARYVKAPDLNPTEEAFLKEHHGIPDSYNPKLVNNQTLLALRLRAEMLAKAKQRTNARVLGFGNGFGTVSLRLADHHALLQSETQAGPTRNSRALAMKLIHAPHNGVLHLINVLLEVADFCRRAASAQQSNDPAIVAFVAAVTTRLNVNLSPSTQDGPITRLAFRPMRPTNVRDYDAYDEEMAAYRAIAAGQWPVARPGQRPSQRLDDWELEMERQDADLDML